MKYFLIAGEASGDLHAGRLITALKKYDNGSQFRFLGGDCMQKAAGNTPCHPLQEYGIYGFL